MPDRLRLVTRREPYDPVVELDLNDGDAYRKARDGLAITPPQKAKLTARVPRRHGGLRVVGEDTDNGQVGATILVRGTSPDSCLVRLQALLDACEDLEDGQALEWRPAGATRSVYFALRGTADLAYDYNARQFEQIYVTTVSVVWNAAPVLEGDGLDAWDDFSTDGVTAGTWTVDAGTGTVSVSAGKLVPSTTGAKRLRRTGRGHAYTDLQVMVKVTTGSALGSMASGVLLRAGATDYIAAVLTPTALEIRKNGTTVASDAITPGTGSDYYVRARVEGNVVRAELFNVSTPPSPMQAENRACTYTLAGGDLVTYASGQAGIHWTPGHASERIDDFRVSAYTYRNVATPAVINLGTIPGDVEPLADVEVTTSGTAYPWALLAAWETPATPASGAAPVGILQAETATDLTVWATGSDGSALGGSVLHWNTTGLTASASWLVDPSVLVPDDFSASEIDVEVWAGIVIGSAVASPRLVLSAVSADGVGAERFTRDVPSRAVTAPSSGTTRRTVRLGVLTLGIDAVRGALWKLKLAGSRADSSGGNFEIDALFVVPVRSRATGLTGRANDAGFPRFIGTTSEVTKQIRADGSAFIAKQAGGWFADVPLSSPVRIPNGPASLLVKLSQHVPDDPTASTDAETATATAWVHVPIIPRYLFARGA